MMFATSVQYCHPGRPRRRVLLLLAAGHLLFPWYIHNHAVQDFGRRRNRVLVFDPI